MKQSEKNKIINHIYQQKQLFRFVAGKGKVLLGIQIQKLKPQNINEWREWVEENQEIPQTLAIILQRNSKHYQFDNYREIINILTYEDYYNWASNLVVNSYWKGYSNELIAQDYFVEKGFEIKETSFKDDVRNSLDFFIYKDKDGERLSGGVSVKSGGYLFQNSNLEISRLHQKLAKSKNKLNLHKVFLVIVNNSQEVIIHKTY